MGLRNAREVCREQRQGGGGGGGRRGTRGTVPSKRGPNTTGWLGKKPYKSTILACRGSLGRPLGLPSGPQGALL
eukprot:12728-Pyramimonas_sp.AAC.1